MHVRNQFLVKTRVAGGLTVKLIVRMVFESDPTFCEPSLAFVNVIALPETV
jgi:hypothetical protein